MRANATWKELSRVVMIGAILSVPMPGGAAQIAKTPPAKEPAGKAAPIDANAAWLLAGSEGECVPLSILAKRGSAYADIKGPTHLAEQLRANGHQAEIKEFKAGSRPAVEVRAPTAGIHVMFVKQELCDKGAGSPAKK